MQASSECLVFIDGEYWGIYQITEKVSDDFIKSHYGIDKSDVAIIKNSELEEGTDQDLNDWNNIISKCANSDMTNTANYEEVMYEGYGPNGVAVIVEGSTDNKNRTAADVRHAFDKSGGNLGTTGCVSYMFNKKGVLVVEKNDKYGVFDLNKPDNTGATLKDFYQVGSTFGTGYYSNYKSSKGNSLPFTMEVLSINDSYATVKIIFK